MIIALCGRKGSGKSTLAKMLRQANRDFALVPFAAPIKDMLRELLLIQGVSPNDTFRMLSGDLKEIPTVFFGDKSPRHAMQTLGTEWGRNLMHQNFWTGIWIRRTDKYENVIVDDLRFLTEAEAMRSVGGIIVKVTRPETDKSDSHQSETELDIIPCKYTINNSGTIQDAWENLRLIIDIESYSVPEPH